MPRLLPLFLLLALATSPAQAGSDITQRLNSIRNEAPKTTTPDPRMAVEFHDENGKTHTLHTDFHGKVVVLNFWATWCAPCVEEMPGLDHLQKTYASKGLEVVAVSQDFGGLKSVKRFFNRANISHLPIYLDIKNQLFGQFGSGSLPLTILIDRNGKIHSSQSGFINWHSTKSQAKIAKLLAQ